MTDDFGPDFTAASDGLPARKVEPWAKDKLHYLSRYIDAFTTAMKDKWRLVYIDLFSGPGRSVITDTGEEILGSPFLALEAKTPFTQLFFNDINPEATLALAKRVGTRSDVVISTADCNAAAIDAGARLFADPDAGRTLGLAFIDPTAFHIGFDAIAVLTQARRVDVIITVMTSYMKRFMDRASFGSALDQYFGSPDWRDMVDSKSDGEKITSRRLLDHYEGKLRLLGYAHFDDGVRVVNSKESTIYHLVLASRHPLATKLFGAISKKDRAGQFRMEL